MLVRKFRQKNRNGSFDVSSPLSVNELLPKNACKYSHYFTILLILLVFFT